MRLMWETHGANLATPKGTRHPPDGLLRNMLCDLHFETGGTPCLR